MTKKDEKDADRPHYYSQFWLDVAAGRRVIGTPKPEDGTDLADADADLPEPTPFVRKSGRVTASAQADGYRDTHAAAVAEPEYADVDDELSEPDEEESFDLASDLDDEDIPNIVVDEPLDDESDDLEIAPVEEEEEALEDDEEFFDEEGEEEEEDDEWAGRGRKKPKPGRQVKTPKPPVKKPKRGRAF